jgi:hypothetical protein
MCGGNGREERFHEEHIDLLFMAVVALRGTTRWRESEHLPLNKNCGTRLDDDGRGRRGHSEGSHHIRHWPWWVVTSSGEDPLCTDNAGDGNKFLTAELGARGGGRENLGQARARRMRGCRSEREGVCKGGFQVKSGE